MTKTGAVASVLLGICLLGLGLLFLMGAGGQGHRYLIGVVALALGSALVGLGVWIFKRSRSRSPEQMEAEILALAKREDGEVSLSEIAALLGDRFDRATPLLARLVELGVCQPQEKDNQPYYLFPHLQPRLMVIRCEFCQAELPLNEPVEQCPRCGGSVASKVESRAASDDSYSMD